MAPNSRILICRHSQAEHNVELDYSIPDAPLTALGRRQSAALPVHTPNEQGQVEVILSSGLKRTLQSTLLGWAPAVQRLSLANIVVLPQLQECNDYPCDRGSDRAVLEADPEFKGLNLEQLTPDWTSKAGFYAPDDQSLAARAQWVRQYLRSRPEATILVVAHGDVIRRITASTQGPSTYAWKNAEVRAFRFDPNAVQTDQAWLVEEPGAAIADGYDPHTHDVPEPTGVVKSNNGPSLPGLAPSGSLSLDDDATSAAKLADIAQRVQQKAAAVQSQTSELQELEARLAAAEAKKAELEAKGIRI